MRSSPLRVHSAPLPPSREKGFKDAGLNSARALTRLLLALIESLGQHDKVGGRRSGPGARLSAFGPTPLGGEIERMMAAQRAAAVAPAAEGRFAAGPRRPIIPAGSDAVTPEARPPVASRPSQAPRPAADARHDSLASLSPARPIVDAAAKPQTNSSTTTADRPAAVAGGRAPFVAAPGVRYMRTPDHLRERARACDGPFLPIAPPAGIAPGEAAGEGGAAATPDPTNDAASLPTDDAAFSPPEPVISSSTEEGRLNHESQADFKTRLASPRRLSMTSGIAVALPAPANDLVAAAVKQPFAVTLRAKPKASPTSYENVSAAQNEPAMDESAISAAAVAARVSLQAEPAPVMPRRAAAAIEWDYPSPELLGATRKPEGNALTAEMLEQNARLLETTLEDFGIRGEIIHVRAGPVVTLYELEPAPGTKSSRVIGLADDIARSMSALSARVAVVPGRNAIGIELPNERRETVYFREMVECAAFADSTHKLAIALGKTIGGEPVIAELAKMPHLLVAGTTGSGKSVAINTMILSLLFRLRPDECRLIMVDPKMLELSVYDGIPHLLTPVVTDPKKAVVALKWAVREMEDRYKKMSKLGVRNIDGFNARVAQAKAAGETITLQMTTGYERETGKPTVEDVPLDLVPLPFIVVIVDEMADLMMVAGKDIEGAIQRLAQMARAAGIHLIMATQRPSVDVITGTIKANFPTRISFQVTSKIDSRTILGEQGAEQLLGQGDMLHMQGGGRIYRVHGPFVSDEDVERVVAHLKAQGQPDYLESVTEEAEASQGEEASDEAAEALPYEASAGGPEDDDTLYDQAVKIVLRDKKSSVSYVQRRLAVGYNKAATIIERMEKEGVLGPANHTGKREILAHGRGRVISGVPAMAGED